MPFPRSAFSGFPFDDRDDDQESRDDSFRSQLDDLAKRHPEFAEHFGSFPFRSGSVGNRSRPPRPSEDDFRRFAGRPFGSSRFERFGFPFTRDPFDEDIPPEGQPQQQQEQPPQESQSSSQPQEASQNPQQPEQPQRESRRKQQNIQQSNTVDLGQAQKDDSLNENRNQRSMSAPPPDNRAGQQRFVSSINIPINADGMGDNNMGAQQSQEQRPTERIIPIHVEGRDEPIISKNTGPSFTQQAPQPERIFGHRPSQFTQFVNREPQRQHFGAPPEYHYQNYAHPQQQAPYADNLKQQQQQYQQQQQQKFQQQQDREVPVQKQPQQQQQAPPPPQPVTNNPIDIIQAIQKDVSELMGQVEKFSGIPRDKQYLYLDEMLTRNLIKLDNVDTQGQENIRVARKEAIKCIEKCISILEAKAAANVPKDKEAEEKMEVETKPEDSEKVVQEEKMEVEVKPEPENVVENKPEEKMEVVAAESSAEVSDSKQEETPVAVEEKPSAEDESKKPEEAPASNPEIKEEQSSEPAPEDDKKEKKKGKKKVAAKK